AVSQAACSVDHKALGDCISHAGTQGSEPLNLGSCLTSDRGLVRIAGKDRQVNGILSLDGRALEVGFKAVNDLSRLPIEPRLSAANEAASGDVKRPGGQRVRWGCGIGDSKRVLEV